MEVTFPRGGSKRVYEKTFKKEDDLFKLNAVDGGKKSKTKKSDKKKKDVREKDELPVVVEQLSFQTLSVGMIVLGCVQDVFTYSVTFALPGGLYGTVQIPNISDPYTRLLKTFAEDPESVAEVVVSPPTMFIPGSCFPVKVVGKDGSEPGVKKKVSLSTNPKEVNESLTLSCLYHQMTLLTAVESVEDHGYIMDIGIAGLKGFLSSAGTAAFVQKVNHGRPLAVGQPVLCKVNMPKLADGSFNERIIPLVAKHKTSQTPVLPEQNPNLHNLLPGVCLKAEVQEVRKNGLVVGCFGYGGCIWKDHLREPWDTPFKYDVGQEVECTLIYQTPMTHTLHLSLLPIPNSKNVKKRFGDLKPEDLVDEATVIAVETAGVYLKLHDNVKAMAKRSHLSDLDDIVSETFKIGDVHGCRILQFSPFEMMAQVSLKWSVLRQHIVPLEEIKVGVKLDCIVVKVLEKGLMAKVSKNIVGFVRDIHMADVPPSDPVKRFPVGKKIACRVLRVDRLGDKTSPLLTCKKTLVKSKLPPLVDYGDAMPNRLFDGVVVRITQAGLVVSFYADVQGWLPIKEASYERVYNPQELFYVGQVVKCRVVRCIPDEKRLLVSLKLDINENRIERDHSKKRYLRFGAIYEAKIIKKSAEGLDVEVEPNGPVAHLPINHLSDHPKLSKILLNLYSEGDTISRVLCFSTKGNIIVSKKSSLIQASEEGLLIEKFDDLQPDMILHGVVKGFTTYGIFVVVGNGISGLTHLKMLTDGYLSHVNDAGYVTHSSVAVKVLRVDAETKRIEFSAKMKDVYDGDVKHGLDLLHSFMNDWKDIVCFRSTDKDSRKQSITKFEVGTVVSATVTEVTDEGVLCDLGDGVKGFAVLHHLGDLNCRSGKTFKGLVLHVDVVNDCIELALSPQIVKKAKAGHLQKVRVGQVYQGVVMLLRDHFVLAFLHKPGCLVYLPVKMHLNDVVGYSYGIGEAVSITVARLIDGQILGTVVSENDKRVWEVSKKRDVGERTEILRNNFPVENKKQTEVAIRTKKRSSGEKGNGKISISDFVGGDVEADHSMDEDEEIILDDTSNHSNNATEDANADLKIGDILTAEVTAVKRFQLNVLVKGRIKGRVHVTEIGDSISEGVNPLQDFKAGQKIEVRVIGHRELKTHRFLVVSHRWTRTIPEFSLKEKLIQSEEIREGQELTGFVEEFLRSCLWVWLTPKKTGRINLLNLSQNPNVLRKVEEKFVPSQAIKVVVQSVVKNGPIELTKIRETKLEKGKIILGLVLSARRDLGVFVRLPNGFRGTVALTDMRDNYKPASVIMEEMIRKKFVRCCILDVDTDTKMCRLSTRASRFKKVAAVDDPEIESLDSLKKGSVVRGFATSLKKDRMNVALGHDLHGVLMSSSFPEGFGINPRERIPLGTVVRVRIESVEDQTPILSLLDYKAADTDGAGVGIEIQSKETRKRRRISSTSEIEMKKPKDEGKEAEDTLEVESSTADSTRLPRLELNAGFDWNIEATPNLNSLLGKTSNVSTSSSSDSEDDGGETDHQTKRKKKSKKQKLEEARREEDKLCAEERRLMDKEWQPETVDDFDRMVATSPDSSLIWLKYMAFHLQQAEVEKARAVAERALKTICFRDEQEKLNIWVAMLNLENLYGTRESLGDIFQRALQHNEPIKVYTHMVNIYDSSEKVQEAEEMHSTMVKKFRKNRDVWIGFGLFYMKRGKPDAARQLMQRSLNSLDKKEHIEMISKFAQMEFKLGDAERGKTMFEGIVGSYTKRIDQWSIYIDMLLKSGDVDAVRNLFDRAITLSVSAKRMKFFFKRFLEFERQHGDEDRVQQVKQKALNYVESKVNLDE